MKNLLRNLFLILISMSILGYFLLICVYCLPVEMVHENVLEASNIMQMEGSHPELIYGHQDTMLDNQTDSIMLLIARHEGGGSVYKEALLANRVQVKGMIDAEVLASEANGEALEYSVCSYGRYWHGYLLYLKPLLVIFNYGQIRYLIGLIQISLFVSILCLLISKNHKDHILPFTVSYLFLNPSALSLSLQYLPISVITMVQLVIVLLTEEKYKNNYTRWIYHFFVVGCLTSYFDFLTYPMLTLGMPLVYLLAENRSSPKHNIAVFFGSCVAWGSGYVLMWSCKWILGSLLTEENIIREAAESILFRTGALDEYMKISVWEIFAKNLGANKIGLMIALLLTLSIVIFGIFVKHKIYLAQINLVVLLCALLPFLWYTVIANHSYIHYWFTYRILAVSIYAVNITAAKLFDMKKDSIQGRKIC